MSLLTGWLLGTALLFAHQPDAEPIPEEEPLPGHPEGKSLDLPAKVNWDLDAATVAQTRARRRIDLKGWWRFAASPTSEAKVPRAEMGWFEMPGQADLLASNIVNGDFEPADGEWRGKPLDKLPWVCAERDISTPALWVDFHIYLVVKGPWSKAEVVSYDVEVEGFERDGGRWFDLTEQLIYGGTTRLSLRLGPAPPGATENTDSVASEPYIGLELLPIGPWVDRIELRKAPDVNELAATFFVERPKFWLRFGSEIDEIPMALRLKLEDPATKKVVCEHLEKIGPMTEIKRTVAIRLPLSAAGDETAERLRLHTTFGHEGGGFHDIAFPIDFEPAKLEPAVPAEETPAREGAPAQEGAPAREGDSPAEPQSGTTCFPSETESASTTLQPGVRGVATRAPAGIKIDGDLAEFHEAFCTPVCYFEPDLANRAAQFFYMWDDEAFYAGLRTLDQKQANPAPDNQLWEGDGVEWYFDTRRGDDFRDRVWGPGAVHMYWAGYKNDELQPRWCLRPDMLQAIPGQGVEVAARKTSYGAEVEFKLPWANFSGLKVGEGDVIALDSELCYSDGGARVYRTFAYGSPLSVQQPASLGKVQLVDKLLVEHWRQCGPVMMPVRCDTPWGQETKAHVTGTMVVPPNHAGEIGKLSFRLIGLDNEILGEYEGQIENFSPEGNFQRAVATWPSDAAAPGGHFLMGVAYDKQGRELARVAPRMVSVHNTQGY